MLLLSLALLVSCGPRAADPPPTPPTQAQTGEAALARQRALTGAGDTTPWTGPTDYQIQVSLDADARRFSGSQRLQYQNQSGDILDRLPFHLYLNAFRDHQSLFATSYRALQGDDLNTEGFINLSRFTINGRDVLDQVSYPHHPDQTVAVFPLPAPLFPGESVTVECDFSAQLPDSGSRSMAVDGFFFVAQWFPKIGVWESSQSRGTAGGWVCPPYHALSEFYADFGRYQVVLDVPDELVLGATGVLVDERRTAQGGRKQLTYVAEQVHDFAWSASSRFIRLTEQFEIDDETRRRGRDRFGLDDDQTNLPALEMVLLLQPEHAHQAERHFAAMRRAVIETGFRLGPYPYPVITMVDPIYRASEAGGMEYPMLVSLSTHWAAADTDYDLEDLIFHEFIHQYFQGMIATNEHDNAWMDEGFTTYLTAKLIHDQYGPGYTGSFQYLLAQPYSRFQWLGVAPFHQMQNMRRSALTLARGGRIDQAAPSFVSFGHYYDGVYDRAALMLFQLEQLLGEETMADLLRAWFLQQRFKHPDGAAFRALAQTFSEQDLGPFFEDWLHGEGFLDYAVAGVQRQTGDDEAAEAFYQVTLVNHGNLRLPVTLALRFEDGTTEHLTWPGDAVQHVIEGSAATPLVEVMLDPEGRLIMDRYRANNGWRADPDHQSADQVTQKTTNALQHWLQLLAGAVL